MLERLEVARIANARLNTMHEVWEHPQLRPATGGARSAPRPDRCRRCCRPGSWDDGPRMDPVPALGEHTDALLAELGLDAAEIAALRDRAEV